MEPERDGGADDPVRKPVEVLVRWKTKGALILDGIGYPRKPGEQDVMDRGRAGALAVCGMVEVIGNASDVPVVGSVDDAKGIEGSEGSETERLLTISAP